MIIAIPKERRPGEARVAASPDTVKKFKALGFDMVIESGAGVGAAMTDEAYKAAGATIAPDEASALKDADIVLKVQRPEASEVALMKSGALLLALMAPHAERAIVEACARQNVTAFALELVPRITRAQSMDVLSSQANLAGYRAVIDGAEQFRRGFPMLMPAAGTVPPA